MVATTTSVLRQILDDADAWMLSHDFAGEYRYHGSIARWFRRHERFVHDRDGHPLHPVRRRDAA